MQAKMERLLSIKQQHCLRIIIRNGSSFIVLDPFYFGVTPGSGISPSFMARTSFS